jgi:hypothetical protein
MALTFAQLMTELAALEGKTFDATAAGGTSEVSDESMRFQYVQQLNAGLRWVLSEYDQEWCWPEWVADSGSVAVDASNIVALTALVDSGTASWCSLWTSDPRVKDSTAEPVEAYVSNDGVHLVSHDLSSSTLFAFYRKAVPQGTWSAGGTYASPSTIPDQLRMPVVMKAHALRLRAAAQWAEAGAREKEGREWMDARKASLLSSGALVWQDHFLVL